MVGQAQEHILRTSHDMPTPPMKIKIVGNIIKYGRHGFIITMEEYSFFKKNPPIWSITWALLGMYKIELKVTQFTGHTDLWGHDSQINHSPLEV